MQRWRKVAVYMADREKGLTAESSFQNRCICMFENNVKFHAGAAQVKSKE
ncbi:MAG: hypothetical protein J6B28_10175 [Eubacterium sp.]|nr:hypothetical protein [Eubacterium sp.]